MPCRALDNARGIRAVISEDQSPYWCLHGLNLAEILDDEAKGRIHARMEHVDVRAGEPVFLPGDPADSIYTVHYGKIELSCRAEDGRKLTLWTVTEGRMFGETELLGPEERRRWAAEAVEDSMLCSIPRDLLYEVIREHPLAALSTQIGVGENVRRLQNKLEDLVLRSAPARVAQTLLRLWDEETEGEEAPIPLTHRELADLVGATRETVSSVLGRFEREGWISKGRGSIRLLNLAALRGLRV